MPLFCFLLDKGLFVSVLCLCFIFPNAVRFVDGIQLIA